MTKGMKIIKKADVKIDEHITKRNISIDEVRLPIFLNLLENSIEMKKNCYTLKSDYKFPDFIKTLSYQLKTLYSLKDEAEGFTLHIFPPEKTYHEKDFKVPDASVTTVSRIVMVFGGNENFNLHISQKGQTADADVFCPKNSSFNMNLGIITSIDVEFNSSKTFKVKAFARGGRPEIKRKDPTKRTVIVLDFEMNMAVASQVVAETIKDTFAPSALDELKATSEKIKEKEEIDFFMSQIEKDEDKNDQEENTKKNDDEDDVEDIEYEIVKSET